MLRRGGDLVEIAQVLRQSDLGTTSGYAKVDRVALRTVAQPWPGVRAMSAFASHAEEYLRLRRALGHDLADAARLLPRFVAHLDAIGASTITIEVALAWVQRPDADPASSVWSRRMTVVRGFARHMSGIDPATEMPPLGLVTFRQRWRPPFIYSAADVEALMAAVPRLIPTPLRAATFQTMIGLLAATGMRVGEAIALGRADVDWAEGVVVVRASKFNKSREVPLHPTTVRCPRRLRRDPGPLRAPAREPDFLRLGQGHPGDLHRLRVRVPQAAAGFRGRGRLAGRAPYS